METIMLAIAFQIATLTIANNQNQIKAVNVMCECTEKYWTCLNCTIKQQNRQLSTLTIVLKLNTKLTDILITPKISQKPLMVTNNSYRKIFETTINACTLLNGNTSNHILISRQFIELVRPYTNMANGCPYEKLGNAYYWIDVPMLGSMVPSLIPSGRYKLEMDSFSVTHNETIFTMVIIIDVRHTLLVNW